MLSDYVVTKDGELHHYGVKGMKWGVRRDYRVLANHRRNQAVRDAKKDYREGKISKSDRKEAIKKAKNYTKDFKKETKAQFKNAKTRGLRCKIATVDEWLSGDCREDVIGAIEQGASRKDAPL